MAVRWCCEAASPLTPATVTLLRSHRDAQLASDHLSPTAFDDVLFDAAVEALQAFFTAVDPTTQGDHFYVHVESGAADLVNAAPFVHLMATWNLSELTSESHCWAMDSIGQLTSDEELLAQAAMAAHVLALGRTVEPADVVVFGALVLAARSWLLDVAPLATDVAIDYSAVVSDGSLQRVSVSLDITVTPPPSTPVSDPLAGVISPPALTGDVNNYNPVGLAGAVIIRLSASGLTRSITGLAGGVASRQVVVYNVGTTTIILRHNSNNSSAANRFQIGADVSLASGRGAILIYDPVSLCWRIVGVRL